MKTLVIMDAIDGIKPYKDTSFALLLAAQARGHECYYCTLNALSFHEGKARAKIFPIRVFDKSADYYHLGDSLTLELADFSIILMRKDPPFDSDYLYATHLLDHAQAQGVVVANAPQALRDVNEKLFILHFPQCIAPTLVSANANDIRAFWETHGDIILKPLHAMGGAGIFRLKAQDPNIGVILETLTSHGQRLIMAQRYLPEIAQGDKRILLIDGEPLPYCLARLAANGETRANLAAGGRGLVQPLSERDYWLAAQVGPRLKQMGLRFVGLDVIGDFITEINVTSPTCLREIEAETGLAIADQLLTALESSIMPV
jgi:glutathione synthase